MSNAVWSLCAAAAVSFSSSVGVPQQAQPGAPTTPPAPAPAEPAKPDPADPSVKRDTSHHNLEKNKSKPAIGGYDPVAYFHSAPKKGAKDFAYTYRGITYWFASRENLDAFKKDPVKHEPAYGGWCAYAMGATGEKVEIDPTSFKITNGRLFLFYKDFFNDTKAKWTKDEPGLRAKADANWKKTTGA